MPDNKFDKYRDIIDSFYRDNQKLEADDFLNIFIPLSFLELLNRGDILNVEDSLVEFAKEKSHIDPYNIGDSINAILVESDKEQIEELSLIVLDKFNDVKPIFSYDYSRHDETKAIYSLLEIKDGDTIFDLGSGNGVFLANVLHYASCDNIENLKIYGQEIDEEKAEFSQLVLAIFGENKYQSDIRVENGVTTQSFRYNKGFVYSPVGQYQYLRGGTYHSLLYPNIEFDSSTYEQWIYVDRMLAGLEGDDFRAVAVLFRKSLTETQNNLYLQRLLDDGLIEGIIEMPADSFQGAGAESFLMVFSKGNDTIRSIWFNDLVYKPLISDMKYSSFVRFSFHPDEAVKLYYKGSGNQSRILTKDQLRAQHCWWPTSKPITSAKKDAVRVPLNQLAECTICTPYTASDFAVTNEHTGYKIITTADITENGVEWKKLKSVPKYKEIFERGEVHEGDVLVTNKTSKIKVAVVDHEPEDKTLLIGSNVILRPYKEECDPTYLKMFLDSDEGQRLIETTSTGTTVIHLGGTAFFDIGVPALDIEKQREMASKYNEKMKAIQKKQKEIEKLSRDIKKIFLSDEDDK